MSNPDDLVERLSAATTAMLGLRERMAQGEPWPLADVYGNEPEASWGPRELLAHVTEMIPFWLGEAERVLEGATAGREPVPFGRSATDSTRLAIIGRDRTLPLRELLARLEADSGRLGARMRTFDGRDGGRVGLHPRLGEMTVVGMLDRFVVGHLEGHVEQLQGILAAAGR
jgi:hypothetical protein